MFNYRKSNSAPKAVLLCMALASILSMRMGLTELFSSSDNGLMMKLFLPMLIPIAFCFLAYGFVIAILERFYANERKITTILFPLILGVTLLIGVLSSVSVLGIGGSQAYKEHYLIAIDKYKVFLTNSLYYRKQEVAAINLLKHYKSKHSVYQTFIPDDQLAAKYLNESDQQIHAYYDKLVKADKASVVAYKSIMKQLDNIAYNLKTTTENTLSINVALFPLLFSIENKMLKLVARSSFTEIKEFTYYLKDNQQYLDKLIKDDMNGSQLQELVYHQRLIRAMGKDIDEILNTLQQREKPKMPILKVINPSNAIFYHWDSIIGSWIIAIFIQIGILSSSFIVENYKFKSKKLDEEVCN